MYEPVVLIHSLDVNIDPPTIVKGIRKLPNDQNQVKQDNDPTKIDYLYHIQAKHCEVIHLVPLDSLHDSIQGRPDGIVIYFSARNRSILEVLPSCQKLVENNLNSSFNILVCNTLLKSSEDGIAYDEVKQLCPTFDVIELEPDDGNNASKSLRMPVLAEVHKLIQAMQNHVWTKPSLNSVHQSEPGDKPSTSTTQPPEPIIAANPVPDCDGQLIRSMKTKLIDPERAPLRPSKDKMSKPVLLIMSLDETVKPESIVEKIRKQPNDQNQISLVQFGGTVGHPLHIHTKYYTCDVVLVAHESPSLNSIPSAIVKLMEGILIYFNAKDRSCLEVLRNYWQFVRFERIDFGVLLCSTLPESITDGVTYGEVKQLCPTLDVIELEPTAEDVASAAAAGEAFGVDELVQEIHTHVWSNPILHRRSTQVEPNDEPAPSTSTASLAPAATDATDDVDNDDDDDDEHGPKLTEEDDKMIESALEEFERLMTVVMDFQPNTSAWSSFERFMHAQQLAEMFDDMVEKDD